jgi:L-fuconolactonase
VSPPALDAHVHVWDLAARPQPWTDGLLALQRSFGLDHVAADLRSGTGCARQRPRGSPTTW